MPDILLIYPFYGRRFDRSPFRFPPLGMGYIASFLKQNDFEVGILDGTFRSEKEIISEVGRSGPRIAGIYAMYSMEKESIALARKIRHMVDLLIVGGPLPTVDPSAFVEDFDMVVMGEAENTVLDIAENLFKGIQLDGIQGTVFRDENGVHHAERRAPIANLNSIPFPARELFDNKAYKQYYSRRFGRAMTSIISSRGCTFTCDFCSRPVFGGTFRSRSPGNIVDEMKSIVNLGYDTVWFADDCFTMSKDRVMRICDEIIERDLKIKWQCLSRADTLDREMASRMKEAGCQRIYFGIEAGDDRILRIMKKDLDLQIAAEAVRNANSANVETGAFFIIGYPGDDDESVLNTIEFATSLPLDYLSFTLPYPIPGTGLHEKVKHVLKEPSKRKINLIDQQLIFHSEFSESKLKFAIVKAAVQFRIRKYLGAIGYGIFGRPFAELTNAIFRLLK